MTFEISPFFVLNKDRIEMDYIKKIYKKRVQAEFESYKDSGDEDDKRDIIHVQDLLMLDSISI